MSIRCFIAVDIEDNSTLAEIIKVKRHLESLDLDIKPVEDENLHITIRFLGNISLGSVESIKNILLDVGRSINKFVIEIQGVGAFPTISRPRVIWVGISRGYEELLGIRRCIDNEILRRKLRDVHEDQHEFSPHITIARMKSSRNINILTDFYKHYNSYRFGVSQVTKIKLKQSTLTPQGPIYRDILTVDLG